MNSPIPFLFFKENKKLLTDEELDSMVKVMLQMYSKRELMLKANYLSSKGVLQFKSISNKKNIDIKTLEAAYRRAAEYSDVAFEEMAGNIILTVNNSVNLIEGELYKKPESYEDQGETYTALLKELNQLLYAKNLHWFLIISGHIPNEKQNVLIEEYAKTASDDEEK